MAYVASLAGSLQPHVKEREMEEEFITSELIEKSGGVVVG
jgi:hypothetical protein